MSAGIAYIVEFATQYALKVDKANYSDPAVALEMKNDPTPTTFSESLN